MGRQISGRIEKDLIGRLVRAKKIIFFLDYDGTLTPIRKKPGLAKISKSAKATLEKLARQKWAEIFIISGRTLKDVRNLVGIKSISYSGNHGIELKGPILQFTHPTACQTKPYIQRSYKLIRKNVKIKGMILENKFYTLSVHYRLVAKSYVATLRMIVENAIRDLRKDRNIKITEGKKVIEVRPNIEWHKGKIVEWILRKTKVKKALPIYIGDDITDEDAFRSLGKNGITVLVSKRKKKTGAKYILNSPSDVLDFIKFVIREMDK